ncbi:DUF983 domain-containing protein [uncultured Tateyamaria sp.]|uniref:DUF983 domain-containing protein n=1 Tax=uncultured Tateyamaria sp. TaxID=455651 RepID=UPI00262ED9E2|nr:DUF983 domain-containing protein [uncultured Tateyamaria sp.]
MEKANDVHTDDRNLRTAVLNGLRLKCPKCGEGALLHSYLKVNASCPVCHEDLSHARADDGPAYLTILIVCHIVGVALHVVYGYFDPSPLMVAFSISAVAVIASILLLPRMKGLIVGVQWAKRMQGFGRQ